MIERGGGKPVLCRCHGHRKDLVMRKFALHYFNFLIFRGEDA